VHKWLDQFEAAGVRDVSLYTLAELNRTWARRTLR